MRLIAGLLAVTTALNFPVVGNSTRIFPTQETVADAGHGGMSHEGGTHGHGLMEVPRNQPIPTVSLIVTPDPVNGWNVQAQVTHFQFAPDQAGKANRPGEGHAHLYVNGQKVARLYGSWFHLETLPAGRNEITITLNANNHQTLAHQGKAIAATQIVEVNR